MKKTIIAAFLVSIQLNSFAQEVHDPQFMPVGGYASTTNATYIEPSVTKKIQPRQKINNLTQRNKAGETIVQRLTDRTYWAQVGFYNVLFYIGDKGVLLFDSLADGSGDAIVKAVHSVTKKPITTLVYSHAHADHIGDAQIIVNDAKTSGVQLQIIATDATAKKLVYTNSTLPRPTKVIDFKKGQFKFEGLTIQAQGFEKAAHTDDSAAWLLTQEKIIHAPDMTNPDQMPYLAFGGSENSVYLDKNLEQLSSGDWTIFSGGHGNIGGHEDIQFMRNYVKDLRAAAKTAVEKVSAGDFFNEKMNNHQAAAHLYFEKMSENVTQQLRAKYGKFYGFEASVPHQAEMILDQIGSYK